MKKISIVLSLLAASAALFSSCNKSSNGGSEEDLILDGVYIYGEATCLDKVSSKGMFAKALDENHNLEVIPGTWEKYVALEGGKTFLFCFFPLGQLNKSKNCNDTLASFTKESWKNEVCKILFNCLS